MAVFCLSSDLADLQARLGRMIVAQTRDGKAVTAKDLKADGAMAVLLRDALAPNLVQTHRRVARRWCMAGRSPTSRMAATR